MNFWDIIGLFFWSYIFISYLFVLLSIISDIFRDTSLNGGLKAVWIIFLVFVPFLTALVYLIARGRTMNERQRAAAERARSEADSYIRSVATPTSPADEIAKARALFEAGSITQTEFDSLKSRALAAA